MFGQTGYIIGQILGGIAVILGFISFQQKSAKRIVCVEIVTSVVFAIHYTLLGAFTATALNAIAIVQCVSYYIRNQKGAKAPWMPYVFSSLMLIAGIITWADWRSVFIIAGLVAYSISIALPNAQLIRDIMFIKSPLCLTYDILFLSIGGICYEITVITSLILGTIRYYRDLKAEKQDK